MIKRYFADYDTTIFNSFKENLTTRSTASNAGASDVLETFVLCGNASTSSIELARILIQFPIDELYADIFSGSVPDSGVAYYLKLFNVAHGETLPYNYSLEIQRISGSWIEGHGLTMPLEASPYTGSGASWKYRSNESETPWVTEGGDVTGSAKTVSFDTGDEDIELDITSFVEDWVNYEASGTHTPNHGLIIKFTNAVESGSVSHYTKRFSARLSEYYFERPVLEARINDAITDDRGNFYASSSLISDIKNKLYFYNKPKGVYANVPSAPLTVKFFTQQTNGTQITPDEGLQITASSAGTGKYYITCSVDTTEEVIWDRWYDSAGRCLVTSSIDVNTLSPSSDASISEYVITIPKLKSVYRSFETARFDLFIREKDWSPTMYTVANATAENKILEKVYFQLRRAVDDQIVIDFDDVSDSTLLSYDDKGNYFELDLSMLQSGYMYELVFAIKIGGILRVQEQTFKFRVHE